MHLAAHADAGGDDVFEGENEHEKEDVQRKEMFAMPASVPEPEPEPGLELRVTAACSG